jgi:hypothetical protein
VENRQGDDQDRQRNRALYPLVAALSDAISLRMRAHLKEILPTAVESRRCHKRIDSLILRAIPSELRELRGHALEVLDRGFHDGFEASDFHRKCAGQSNTVTIVETTKSYLFE